MARLKQFYDDTVVGKLKEQFGYKNVMQIPRITKITLNMGLGEAVANKNVLQSAASDLEKITGQKPVITKAKKSEANFKIREGWPVGAKVTLMNPHVHIGTCEGDTIKQVSTAAQELVANAISAGIASAAQSEQSAVPKPHISGSPKVPA